MVEDNGIFGKMDVSRRDFMKLLGAGSLLAGLGALGIPNILNNIKGALAQGATPTNTTNATAASAASTSGNSGIRPFNVNVPEAELTELRRRINATRWPERELVNDISQGVQLAPIQKLAQHWATGYDWRKVESRLNALPQFMTNIDGLDIHSFTFVRNIRTHCRSL
jgi:hypothetical protein